LGGGTSLSSPSSLSGMLTSPTVSAGVAGSAVGAPLVQLHKSTPSDSSAKRFDSQNGTRRRRKPPESTNVNPALIVPL
jgi:hypothetical protein